MKNESNYLVVSYKELPDTQFICSYDSEIRLRVSKAEKSRFFEVSRESLCAILDSCILIFEDVGNKLGAKEEIYKAILWYKNWLGEKKMIILKTDQ